MNVCNVLVFDISMEEKLDTFAVYEESHCPFRNRHYLGSLSISQIELWCSSFLMKMRLHSHAN